MLNCRKIFVGLKKWKQGGLPHGEGVRDRSGIAGYTDTWSNPSELARDTSDPLRESIPSDATNWDSNSQPSPFRRAKPQRKPNVLSATKVKVLLERSEAEGSGLEGNYYGTDRV